MGYTQRQADNTSVGPTERNRPLNPMEREMQINGRSLQNEIDTLKKEKIFLKSRLDAQQKQSDDQI